ncbi:MAG TPA: hypothetical protein VM537_05575 [Anaerolineae bacterium]|nr:hypothetical protein [Anaerolineae bacterium]
MTKQLSLFTNGEDLPLFSGTAPRHRAEAFAPAAVNKQESLATCRVCLDTGSVGGHTCTCQAGQKPKRSPSPYLVTLRFMDRNMPPMHQKEQTEELAACTMRHWFQQFAGVKSITIEDTEQQQRHVFAPGGYMFTVPIL